MAPNPSVMKAVEALDYRVTPGDVASQAGLNVRLAERELVALASDAGGHLQVAESGEIAYLFPKNFRGVLQSKYRRLQLQAAWEKVWNALFYLIRISFGIFLILSIVIILVAITALIVVLNSQQGDRDNDNGFGGGMIFMPRFWFGPDIFWIFYPDYYDRRRYRSYRQGGRRSGRRADDAQNRMNFLEAVFSFLFGDGNPNADLEERRWQAIATIIRSNGGAVAAEQVAPYLDNIDPNSWDEEDYMLPVLTRFNGRPEVSDSGQIIYHFPELQITASEGRNRSIPDYLHETPWPFSEAGSNQLTLAGGLGIANIVGAIVLGGLLRQVAADPTLQLGAFLNFVSGAYGFLLVYAIAFLTVPLLRWLWLRRHNRRLEARNQERQTRVAVLDNPTPELQHKIGYARQFAATTVVSAEDLAYTTESSLLDQEAAQSDRIDEEWRRRIEQSR
ncbi:MAG: hypothetical protein ACFB8W_06985 [Elainellaceae cyanobacterium]